MAMYGLSLASTVTTTTAASWDCKAGANESIIREFGVVNGAATTSSYGYGVAANVPVQTGGVALVGSEGGGGSGVATCAVAWSTAPTVPAAFVRRTYLKAEIGDVKIFTFPRGFVLQAGTSFVQWNITANSALVSVHILCDE